MGMHDSELYATRQESFKVNIRQGEVEDYKVSTSQGVSLRTIIDGKVGYAYTEAMDDQAVDFLIQSARDNAGIIESADPQVIFPGSDSYSAVEGYCQALADLTPQWKIEQAKRMEKAAWNVSDKVQTITSCALQSSDYSVQIINTKGLDLSYRGTVLYARVGAAVADGDLVQSGDAYRCYTDADHFDFEAVGREAVERALAKCAPINIPSRQMPVIIQNETFCDLLQTFEDSFSADAAQRGLSLLTGKEGEMIAAPLVTLMDDPLYPGGLNSRPFDDEGVACYTKAVVENGQLKTLLHNLKTAAKQGVQSTGNAAKAATFSPIAVAPSNFYLKPGQMSKADLLRQLGSGLLITELQGMHSGANGVSGDFSLAARGFVVEDGRVGQSVEEITVAGNFYQVLKDITHLADDLVFGMPSVSCVGSPSVLVSSLAISG